jgi:hypothetical protein
LTHRQRLQPAAVNVDVLQTEVSITSQLSSSGESLASQLECSTSSAANVATKATGASRERALKVIILCQLIIPHLGAVIIEGWGPDIDVWSMVCHNQATTRPGNPGLRRGVVTIEILDHNRVTFMPCRYMPTNCIHYYVHLRIAQPHCRAEAALPGAPALMERMPNMRKGTKHMCQTLLHSASETPVHWHNHRHVTARDRHLTLGLHIYAQCMVAVCT